MCTVLSPWIRFLEIDGQMLRKPYSPGKLLWLTTGDVIEEYGYWPACELPVPCALCGARSSRMNSPVSPLFWDGKLLWYCHLHVVQLPWLGERMREKEAETRAEVLRLYPIFNPYAAPGEEWV